MSTGKGYYITLEDQMKMIILTKKAKSFWSHLNTISKIEVIENIYLLLVMCIFLHVSLSLLLFRLDVKADDAIHTLRVWRGSLLTWWGFLGRTGHVPQNGPQMAWERNERK